MKSAVGGGRWRFRRVRWLVALLAVWANLSAAGNDGAGMLTIAAYNLENYVVTSRRVDGVYSPNYPKPEAEKAALRQIIRNLNADVLAMEEMGPQPYLDELQRDLDREGLHYTQAVLLEAADPDRHIALFAKFPLAAVVRHTDLSVVYFGQNEKVKRGLLEVRINTREGEVTVFVVHLKSRFTDRSEDPNSLLRRSAEAVAVRDRILQRFPEPAKERFLILGDFNDSPASRPLRALCERGKTAIATILPAVDQRGETWTHYFRKEDVYSRVDFILASPGVKPLIAEGRASIYDDPQAMTASDHRPVIVKLNTTAR